MCNNLRHKGVNLTVNGLGFSVYGLKMDDVGHEFGQPLRIKEVEVLEIVVIKMQQSPCIIRSTM